MDDDDEMTFFVDEINLWKKKDEENNNVTVGKLSGWECLQRSSDR